MRDNNSSYTSASPGADAGHSAVDYQVLNSHAAIKQELHNQEYKGSVKRREIPCDKTNRFKELASALCSKQQLLGTKASRDADEGWHVSWTSNDTQSLLAAVQAVVDELPSVAQADARELVARSLVKAAADLPVQDLCKLALTIKRSWDLLPRQQKQLDHAPLDLVCSLGLLLSRLYPCTTACAAGSPLQQQALVLLQQICSTTAQQLLHESLAGYLFIFRWHEEQQQQQRGEVDPADRSRDSAVVAPADSNSSSSSPLSSPESVLQAGYSRPQRSIQHCKVPPSNPTIPTFGVSAPATIKTPPSGTLNPLGDSTPPCGGATIPSNTVPRLVSAQYVPHAHRKWIGGFLLPVIPTAVHWASAQEVLLWWNKLINNRVGDLGLDLVVSPDVFMLAVEALWLFSQPSEGFISPTPTPTPPAAAVTTEPSGLGGGAKTATAAATAAAAVISDAQLMQLWPSILLRLVANLESRGTAAAAVGNTAAGSSSPAAAAAAAEIRSGLIMPASSVLLSILAETLMHLSELWQQQPAAARSAMIRSVLSGSDLPVVTHQKKISQLIGKAKPKASEVLINRLLLLVKHVAAVMVELLQLERTLCEGPGRDGCVPVTESGEEIPWFTCLWVTSPVSMSQILELLLRCPTPVSNDVTTLIELLMDDLWEALRVLPLLEQHNSVINSVTDSVTDSVTNSVNNTAVGAACNSCELAGVTMLGWGLGSHNKQQQQQQSSLAPDLVMPVVQANPAAAAAAAAGVETAYNPAVAKAVTAAIITTQKAIRSWQAAISQALLLPSATAAAAAAAADPARESTRAKTDRSNMSNRKGTSNTADAGTAAADADTATAAPGWMLAAAVADPGAAVGVMITLLNRGLDCAQKAYYWRWYVWWKQQQQQEGMAHCAATAGQGAATFGSSPGSSSNSSTGAGSSGDHVDDWCGSSGSFLSSSSNSSSYGFEAAAAASAEGTAGSGTSSSSSSKGDTSQDLYSALWGEAAFQHALGFTALAGPAFGFVYFVIKIGYKDLPAAQKALRTEPVLALLDSVSAGLQSNSLILVELNRLLLLPEYKPAAPAAAAVAGRMRSILDSMLAKALTAATVPTKANGTTTAAAAGRSAAGAALISPDPTASLDSYDSYWQQLSFDPIDQMTLSKTAAELVISCLVNPEPRGLLYPVGCHNPTCYNMLGLSECQLKSLACRACRQIGYCSRNCQKQHWKVHKKECQRLQQQQDCEWVDVFSEDFADLLED